VREVPAAASPNDRNHTTMSDVPEDKELRCCERDCNQTFTWTVGEQSFYAKNDFATPRRCPPCRAARKAQKAGQDAPPAPPAPPVLTTEGFDDDRGGRKKGRRRGGDDFETGRRR
jgi:hypothetical protein